MSARAVKCWKAACVFFWACVLSLAAEAQIFSPIQNGGGKASGLTPSAYPLLAPDGTAGAPSYSFSSATNAGMYLSGGALSFALTGGQRFAIDGNGLLFNQNVYLNGESAHVLAQRNGTNAQIFRIYNTFTDASNYERLEVGANPAGISANTFGVIVKEAGTGVARDMYLGTQGGGNINFRVSASNKWQIVGATGNFLPSTDAANDVGAPAARVRAAYMARKVETQTTVTYSASMTPDAALGYNHVITATNGTAFTINGPTNPVQGQEICITIRNAAGGALGVATWNAVFKMPAWTQPANGFSRSVYFIYNASNWVETVRSAADIPN